MPYIQHPLQPLQRQAQATAEDQNGLPVNIANGSININVGKMASGMASGANMPGMPVIPKVPGLPGPAQVSPGVLFFFSI